MGLQRLLSILPLLFLACSLHKCYGNSTEGRSSVGFQAEAPPFNGFGHPTDLSGVMTRAGKFSYKHRRSVLGSSSRLVDVKGFGARGDGSSDDTKAFMNAWKAACSSPAPVTLLVPGNKNYLIKPITFSGPCKSNIMVMIQGTVLASPNRSDWDGTSGRHWILFEGVKNLRVEGGGTLHGNGQVWWKNSCKINKSVSCKVAPTALTFHSCSSLKVDNLRFRDSQQIHVSFEECSNVQVYNLVISAPGNSPNTDGIHVAGTTNIQINNCVIRTGDDCISIVSGSRSITVTNIVCGPGHGISIGSLGADGSEDAVSDVFVDTAQLEGTSNGVRIKTWQGGRGYARNIAFKNIFMKNVKNPIIIDQNYCDSSKPCTTQRSAVAITGVTYKNIKGTSATEVALDFDCSRNVPCTGILVQDINLISAGGASTKSICTNVNLAKSGTVVPSLCTSWRPDQLHKNQITN